VRDSNRMCEATNDGVGVDGAALRQTAAAAVDKCERSPPASARDSVDCARACPPYQTGCVLRFAPRYWMLCVFGAAPASFSEWWHRG